MATAVDYGDGVANYNVVFVDTSLETHLAMILSDSHTVSDFKRKIMLEHRQLFPAIGDIKVECLKVKRKGSFYHLSDSMLVKCAFSAAKGNWFVSVDASRLEQNDGVQQLGKVTHSCSVERHDNHGSPSVHSKTAPLEISPLVNKKVPNFDQLTSDGFCKDVSKNVEEDKLCNDKQLDYEPQEKLDNVNTNVSLKKRTRDVHNESSPKEASMKKKRKTKMGKSDVKALEENLVLSHDNDKVNEKGASINNDNTFEHRPEDKDLIDENERTNKGENCSAVNQVATVVPSIEVVGSETVGDVAMVVENNIQQEISIGISQKEKDSELVLKPTMENEEHSSLMMTPDCEHDAAGVTATGHTKRSTKHKTTEKEASSTSFIKKLHNTNNNATESSQQDVGPHDQESAGDQIYLLKQKPELKLPGRKKEATGCENTGEGKRRKTKKLFKHSDNLVGDISSTVLASVVDERKTNEVSEKTLVDAKNGDDVIMKEEEISVENMEEKSRKEFTHANDVLTVTNEENALLHSESAMNDDNFEKQTENTVDTTKKKKKTKKAAGRNEDESAKHVGRGVCENVKESESSLPDTDKKDGDMLLLLASAIDERELNRDSEKTLENMEAISKKEFTDANHVATVTDEDNLVNAQGMLDNSEKQNEKIDDVTKKKTKRKTKKIGGKNEDELMTKSANGDIYENVKESDRKDGDKVKEKDAQTSYDGLVGKENKNNESQDLQLELGSNKSQSVDHLHLLEKPLKNATASEVSEINNEVDSIDNRKDMKKTKVENNKVSAGVLKDPNITNMDTFKTPRRTKRIDAQKTNKQQSTSVQTRAKTVESKKVISSQKVKSLLNKSGTIFRDDSDSDSQTHTPPGKPSPSSSSSSEESSFSLHSRRTGSHARKRNEGAGKVNEKPQSKSKRPPIADLLRSSSSFKKSKVAVSSRLENTDDQSVDFVPDTQPI